MATLAGPIPTFVSALDFTFDDDDNAPLDLGETSSAASSRMGTPAASSSRMGGAVVKERNSASVGRMSARASKTSALAALAMKNAPTASSSSPPPPPAKPAKEESPEPLGAHPSKNPIRKSLKLPRAPPLDFSTIRMSAPREQPKREKPRKFGLEEAPVYYPSVEEFCDPMDYIEKIAQEAKEYGICKIVPPEGWRPPFAIPTETFRFKTRLQQLNSMEASARASINFLEQLYLFHRQQGNTNAMTIPSINGKPIDLWKLRHEVHALGGYHSVTDNRKWTAVGKAMNYNVTQNTSICSNLKLTYFRIIVPFEEYVKKVKLAGGPTPPDPARAAEKAESTEAEMKAFADKLAAGSPTINGADTSNPPLSESGPSVQRNGAERVRTASDKLNEALDIKPSTRRSKVERAPGEVCELCNLDHDPDRIVLCDECDRGYHLGCLNPPLKQVPNSQFYCDHCLLNEGADYGFEEGQDHSLYSFRRRADAFKRKWLQDHPLPVDKGKGRASDASDEQDEWAEQIAIEDHFEREFWRLVEAPLETVEVEYGADVQSTKDGAGFPNLEVHPLDPYSRDGWNLNNLPILAGSLLRYIKSDISGMTLPWIYVGMVFSTFAWHKEDHYSYSINYHHLGDTKTWYGIPGEDDEKLEAAMKLAAPELFEQQPDLMFQLVTLMSPGRLKKHGVRVYAVDQRPNEFIITFPRAYHSGFNHGFNFNEAVNFALPDWLPNGLACVERYREIKKNPVFSHDELLMTISTWDKNPRTSRWLLPHIREMVDRELELREGVRGLDPAPEEVLDPNDRDEEDYQCQHCRTLSYLSQIVTEDGQSVSCLDHGSTLPTGPKILRCRFADADLLQLVNRVKNRADKAGRQPDPSTGLLDGMNEPRQSGRKRKPSAALLEAAGELATPPTQRTKIEENGVENALPQFAPPPIATHPHQHHHQPELPESQGDVLVDIPVGDIQVDPNSFDIPIDGTYPSLHGLYTPQASASPTGMRFSPPRPGPSSHGNSLYVDQNAWSTAEGSGW
ncbi:hypothetical protein JCM11251_001334 [Rhodosporidiobolus azoricus]